MFKTGDIIINNAGTFGHVMMCYGEEDDDGVGEVTFIHGTYRGDFSIGSRLLVDVDGGNYWHFRAKNLTQGSKAELKEIADAIAKSAKYGLYRATRLLFGDSSYGKNAKSRLDKYRGRRGGHSLKFVTTITCAEAVILCYQLTFKETDPRFIKKDAAHTMPRTLAQYLLESQGGWTMEHKPGR